MATTIIYVQAANASAAYVAVFGAPLAAGGGAGTSGSPYNSWAQVAADVEDLSPDHSADDLVVNFHPATMFNSGGSSNFDILSGLGRTTNWRSITFQRWASVVAGEPLYADWYPTFDTRLYLASGAWTQGSISAGVWSAGSGDVFRATISIDTNDYVVMGCWVGSEAGDCTRAYTMAGTYCQNLTFVNEEGDYALLDLGATSYIYFKTGTVGSNPTAKYGSFAYTSYYLTTWRGIAFRNCKNITFVDMQAYGGELARLTYAAAGGETNENFTFTRPRHGFGLYGLTGSTGAAAGVPYTNYMLNIRADSPNFDAGTSLRKPKGSISVSQGSQNGFTFSGQIDNFVITDPTIIGYSHSQIAIIPDDLPNPAVDQYPRNVSIYLTDATKGVLTGGANYQRGLILYCPINGRISGMKFVNQTIQTQIGGQIRFINPVFVDNCDANWRENAGAGTDNNNASTHIWIQPGPYNRRFAKIDVKIIGSKHQVNENLVMWGTYTAADTPPDSVQFISPLVVDLGGVRYRPQSSEANMNYTRLTTPFLCETKSSGEIGPIYGIKNGMFVLDAACLGMASWRTGGTGMTSANATVGGFPVSQVTDDGDWSGQIDGNREEATLADFEFDSGFNYIGASKALPQTSPRIGRGYR